VATPESRYIDTQISSALDRAFARIDSYQRDGYCTEQDVLDALYRGWDEAVVDAWREYIGEAD